MKPSAKHVIEWIAKQSNGYAFEIDNPEDEDRKICIRCRHYKPIVALTPSGRWCCGECWAKFFTWPDPIEQ